MIQGSINSLLGMASGAIKGGKAMMAKGTEPPAAQTPAAQPAAPELAAPEPAAPEPAAQPPAPELAAPEPAAPEPAAQTPAAPKPVAPEPAVKAAPSPVDRVNKARKSAAQALSIEQDRLRRSQANAAIREGGVNSWQRGMGQQSMI